MTKLSQIITVLGLPMAVTSFALQGAGPLMIRSAAAAAAGGGVATDDSAFSFDLRMSDAEEEEAPRLVLGDMDAEMRNVNAKSGMDMDFGAIDFLAAAKARAAAQVQSNNDVAGNDEWLTLADEKKEQFGEIDDWENSQKEAGNADSQILMFTEPTPSEEGEDGSGEGDDDEPKLLLF